MLDPWPRSPAARAAPSPRSTTPTATRVLPLATAARAHVRLVASIEHNHARRRRPERLSRRSRRYIAPMSAFDGVERLLGKRTPGPRRGVVGIALCVAVLAVTTGAIYVCKTFVPVLASACSTSSRFFRSPSCSVGVCGRSRCRQRSALQLFFLPPLYRCGSRAARLVRAGRLPRGRSRRERARRARARTSGRGGAARGEGAVLARSPSPCFRRRSTRQELEPSRRHRRGPSCRERPGCPRAVGGASAG